MLVVSVARQLGSGNSLARLLCCPAEAERARKGHPETANLTKTISVELISLSFMGRNPTKLCDGFV
jgi:hypothetical protein